LYNPFTIVGPISNIQITGAGATTVINGAAAAFGLRLNEVTNSIFSDFSVRNSVNLNTEYHINSPTFSLVAQDYNNPPFSVLVDSGCSVTPLNGITNITGRTGI